MVSNVMGLRVELAAVEEAIYREYQGRHKQDPSARPRSDVGRLKSLWSHFDFLCWMIEDEGEEA